MTNNSGKFIFVDNPDEDRDAVATIDPSTVVVIPECPCYRPALKDVVRYCFGAFWWMWLVVVLVAVLKKIEK